MLTITNDGVWYLAVALVLSAIIFLVVAYLEGREERAMRAENERLMTYLPLHSVSEPSSNMRLRQDADRPYDWAIDG